MYMIHVYIPLAMLVILSWTSFWVDHNSVTGRLLIGLSTLLVACIQISKFNESVPPVSYTKAIDVYTGICLTFIFLSILEFCTVNYLSRYYSDNKSIVPQQQNLRGWQRIKQAPFYENFDILSRIIFPVGFLLFVIVYFAIY